MFKKVMIAMAAAAAVFSFSACSSVQLATSLNDQRLTVADAASLGHVNAEIWGLYLFNIPLVTGSSSKPGNAVGFTDTVKVDNAVSMITKRSAEYFESSAVVDMTSRRTSNWIFPFLIFWVDSVQVSGNVIK